MYSSVAELSGSVQQGLHDEHRVPGGFEAVSGDELCHVPGRRQFAGRRSTSHEMRRPTASLCAHAQPMAVQVRYHIICALHSVYSTVAGAWL